MFIKIQTGYVNSRRPHVRDTRVTVAFFFTPDCFTGVAACRQGARLGKRIALNCSRHAPFAPSSHPSAPHGSPPFPFIPISGASILYYR